MLAIRQENVGRSDPPDGVRPATRAVQHRPASTARPVTGVNRVRERLPNRALVRMIF